LISFLRKIYRTACSKIVHFSILVLLLLKHACAGDIIESAKIWGSFHGCEHPDNILPVTGIIAVNISCEVAGKCSIALLQICYIFFTLGMDMLTVKNAGDIINLNSGGQGMPLLKKVVRQAGLSQGKGVVRLES
jgi:hypothetical protein